MTKDGQFFINEKMRLHSRYFCLSMYKVDYDVMQHEAAFSKPGREVYSESGVCAIIAEFDGRCLEVFYSEKTCWDNKRLQSWLRKLLKEKITETAKRVLPARLHYWEEKKKLKAKSVSVSALRKNTLGCCSMDGCIKLSPKILLMPEKYTDSVILHELAHLKHPHHRKPFWDFLSLLLGEDARRQKVGMDVDMSKYWCYMNYIMK